MLQLLRPTAGLLLLRVLTVGALKGCACQQLTHPDPAEDAGTRSGLLSRDKGYFEFSIELPRQEE